MSPYCIQCVVVLYKIPFNESRTLNSLAAAWQVQGELAKQFALLIYDNSPAPQQVDLQRFQCGVAEYCHAPANGGLVAAYNEALALAQFREIKWLLLLDQDTTIHPDLVPALLNVITSPLDENVSAIVPRLLQHGKVISPQIVRKYRNYSYPTSASRISQEPLTALNSAACLRVDAVTALGGFPKAYWLDFLDHIMFHRLQAAKGRILVLDIEMEHQLSVKNIETEMSLQRYANVLAAEWRFVRETVSASGIFIHRLRLLKRGVGYALTLRNKAYAAKTFRALFT